MILGLSFISILIACMAFESDVISFSYFIVQAILSILIFAKECQKYEQKHNKRRCAKGFGKRNTSSKIVHN